MVERYRAAKRANPKMTQGDFAVMTHPTISARYHAASSASEKRRIKESGARYIRLELAGERSGRTNVQMGRIGHGGRYQVFTPVGDEWKSFNLLTGSKFRSTFDIPELTIRLQRGQVLKEKQAEFARRYKIRRNEIDIDNIEVRRIQRYKKMPMYVYNEEEVINE